MPVVNSSLIYIVCRTPLFHLILGIVLTSTLFLLIVSAPISWFELDVSGNCITMWGYKYSCYTYHAELSVGDMPFCYALRNRVVAGSAFNLLSILLNAVAWLLWVYAGVKRRNLVARYYAPIFAIVTGCIAGVGWACMFSALVEDLCDNGSLWTQGWRAIDGFEFVLVSYWALIVAGFLAVFFYRDFEPYCERDDEWDWGRSAAAPKAKEVVNAPQGEEAEEGGAPRRPQAPEGGEGHHQEEGGQDSPFYGVPV